MRKSIVVAFGAAAAVLLPVGDGFISPRGVSHLALLGQGLEKRTTVTPVMSYADKLREARAAKEAASRGRSPPLSPTAASDTIPAAIVAGGGGGAMPMDSKNPFSEDILDSMRTAIAILTTRLQREKPITRSEFERFESAVALIVEDALPKQELLTQAMPSRPPTNAVSTRPRAKPPAIADGSSVVDDDEDVNEGPRWDPKGGYGLPSGVRNSYVIEDMGKMNPEEYQAALRRKVIARAQSARKTGSYGNISAKEYVAFLGKNPTAGDDACESHKKDVAERHNEDFGRY